MSFTSVGSFGTIANSSAGTTLALVPTVTVEAGNLAVIAIGVDNEGQPTEASDFGHLADTVASITDTEGNVWELIGCVQSPLSADGGSCTSMWKSVLDTQLTTGSTITINFGASRVSKAATGWEFEIDGTEVSIEHVRHYATTGTSDAISTTLDDLPNQEYLAIRSVATETRTAGFTPTSGFTEFDEAIGDSGGAATSMFICAEFDIFTGTSITSDPTKSGNDSTAVFVALKEGPQDKPVVLASNLWANYAAGGSPRWPQGHITNDVALMVCETGAEAVTFTTANGFAATPSSPQITSETRLSVFWCRATSSSMAAPVIPDVGDHLVIKTFLIRGCIATGDPWDVEQGSAKDTPSTSVSITGLTTTVDETLVLSIASDGVDTASDEFSAWANADLTRFRELDAWQQQAGNGGGFGVAVGRKATAGAVSATTATTLSSVDNGNLMIAFKPAVSGAALLKIIGETVEISEALQRHVGLVRVRNETVEIGETTIRVMAVIRQIGETVEIQEGTIKAVGLVRQVGESIEISETTVHVGGVLRQRDETIEISEALIKVLGKIQIHNETVELTETTLNFLGKLQVRNETVQITEAVSRHVGLVRQRNETVQISEQTLVLEVLVRVVNEIVDITEQTLRTMALVRQQDEVINISEESIRVMTLVRVVLESVEIDEDTIHVGGIVKVFNEGVQILEGTLKFVSDASQGSSRMSFRAKVNDQKYSDSILDNSKAKVRE